MQEPVYLDYAATTPLDARVAERLSEVQAGQYANPSSNHVAGRAAAAIVAVAAAELADLLQAAPERFLWTSGATESNNLALFGTAKQRAHRGKHCITMRTEHKAVADVFKALEKQGFEVSWLEADPSGILPIERFQEAFRDDTQLASIMHINNETGVIQDIEALGNVCRERGVTFHVDGAQAAGKVPVNLARLPVDLYSLTAHKFYGPKGVGALYCHQDAVLQPIFYGGGQQRRLRPGTMPVDLIAGLGTAAHVAGASMTDDLERLVTLKGRLLDGIGKIDGLYVNGPAQGGYPGILNVGIEGIEGESLLLALEPLCVATGSACNSQNQEPSYVLRAMGRSDLQAQSAVRFSLGRPTSTGDIDFAVGKYTAAVSRLRDLAPAGGS